MRQAETSFTNRCQILGEFWMSHKTDPVFAEWVEENDLGLPLAFCVWQKIIPLNEEVTNYINETWNSLIVSLEIIDVGFKTLDEVFFRFDNPD